MNNNIFKAIKSYVSINPNCILILFPESKRIGDNIYLDAPSYNSWSYSISKGIAKDFRADESATDIIGTYQKYYNIARPLEAAKEIADKINLKMGGFSNGR